MGQLLHSNFFCLHFYTWKYGRQTLNRKGDFYPDILMSASKDSSFPLFRDFAIALFRHLWHEQFWHYKASQFYRNIIKCYNMQNKKLAQNPKHTVGMCWGPTSHRGRNAWGKRLALGWPESKSSLWGRVWNLWHIRLLQELQVFPVWTLPLSSLNQINYTGKAFKGILSPYSSYVENKQMPLPMLQIPP